MGFNGKTNMFKARIKYSKNYPAVLIGHLDIIYSLQRSMRMALWPLKYTCGYNPRVKMSSTPPLSLGFSSDCEYIDVALLQSLESFHFDMVSRKTMEGIEIISVKVIDHEDISVNDRLLGMRYLIKYPGIECMLDRDVENIIESGTDYVIADVLKKNGCFSNPLKKVSGIDRSKCDVRKIGCIWN
ncbi:TIGR03936 family radical SAM-associated protein [Elusimicrobiota bacterium]